MSQHPKPQNLLSRRTQDAGAEDETRREASSCLGGSDDRVVLNLEAERVCNRITS